MSKLRKVGLVLAPVACVALAAAGAGAVQAKGDVNDDGAVDQLDVMLLQKHLIGAITLAPGAGGPQDAADVAPFVPDVTLGDGALDVADLAVLAHAIGEADLDGDGLSADFENEAGTSPL